MHTREPTSAASGSQPDLRLGGARRRSIDLEAACRAIGLAAVRPLPRLPLWWLAVAAVALAVPVATHDISLRDRVRLEAKIRSNFAHAPVLMVGDSITYQAAPTQLCGETVFNAAVPGDRIADLLGDAPDYSARLAETRRVVVAVGVNDAWPRHKDLESWIADYRALVSLYAGRDLVLVEINPADPRLSRMMRKLDTGFIAGANAAIRQIAAETQARVVPAPPEVLTSDGLHPTPAGAAQWRDRLSAAACAMPGGGRA
ncbi:SGNH/GDSL hydrolase family protein [Xanthobacter autotrophicus DSM 431]|uniref:SGNH/GDSL hydrolase family protein n=1 Tax=Xanthobacter nonsaccharivorans TaxID=3119912 RepID=UPI003726A774